MKATVLVAGSMAILVAGCSAPPVHEPPVSEPPVSEPATVSEPPVVAVEPEIKPPVRPAVSDSETLLTYVDHVRKLPAAEFAKELDTVRKLYARARTEMIRMRYAILLSAPAAGPGEDARAMELLDPLLKSADAGVRALATLLSAQIQEQRRAQGLQQKLDALMSLDKSMIERGR
jgi:hypothetical protein